MPVPLRPNDLIHKNGCGDVVFNCPSCGTECPFDSPSTLSVWGCSVCRLIVYSPGNYFLQVLSNYNLKMKKLSER